MVNSFKAVMLAGVLVSGSIAATQVSAGFGSVDLTKPSVQSGVIAANGSVTNLQSSGLLIKVANNGNGKRKGKRRGKGSSGNNGSSSSSSSSGGGSVPAPGPLMLILGMLGLAALRRRNA